VLLCCIKQILGNRYVRSRGRGLILSEPRETHQRSKIANVPTSPCPSFDNLGCLACVGKTPRKIKYAKWQRLAEVFVKTPYVKHNFCHSILTESCNKPTFATIWQRSWQRLWRCYSLCQAFAKPFVKTPFAKTHFCQSILIDPFAKPHLYHSIITHSFAIYGKGGNANLWHRTPVKLSKSKAVISKVDRRSFCLPTLLYSNNVSPFKVSPGATRVRKHVFEDFGWFFWVLVSLKHPMFFVRNILFLVHIAYGREQKNSTYIKTARVRMPLAQDLRLRWHVPDLSFLFSGHKRPWRLDKTKQHTHTHTMSLNPLMWRAKTYKHTTIAHTISLPQTTTHKKSFQHLATRM